MHVTNLLHIERLRDGGSLVASFQAEDSCEYWIMFPIILPGSAISEFSYPVLINRTTGIKIQLNPSKAKIWLNEIEFHLNKLSTFQAYLLRLQKFLLK